MNLGFKIACYVILLVILIWRIVPEAWSHYYGHKKDTHKQSKKIAP